MSVAPELVKLVGHLEVDLVPVLIVRPEDDIVVGSSVVLGLPLRA